MFWDICKTLILALLAYVAFRFAVALKRQREWEAQGVVFSSPFAYFYDLYRLVSYSAKYPTEMVFEPMIRDLRTADGRYPEKVGMYVMGTPGVVFTRPKAVEELFTTKNANYSKHELERAFGLPLISASIVTLQTEHPLYKKKRKALSGAFFKSKMSAIAQNVKKVALSLFGELQQQGDVNIVDINTFTRRVQANIIVSQLIGHEYCTGHKIPYVDLRTGEKSEHTIAGALETVVEDIIYRLTNNVLMNISTYFVDKEIFTVDKRFFANSYAIRGLLKQVIQTKRKLNISQEDASDIVSLLLHEESYASDDEIIDDLIILFIAGSATVQNTTTNFIVNMLANPEEYKRLLAEVDPFMDGVRDNVMEKMLISNVDELEYVKLAYVETMRLNTPVWTSATSCMNKDSKISGVNMRSEEAFWVGLGLAARDPEEWKQPELFKPDRFDSQSEWFKRPDGGKRNVFASSPFLGGIRVCLGKTFAEVTLRFTLPLWFHCFNFEFEKEEHKKISPVAAVAATEAIQIPLKMTTRNKVSELPNFTMIA